MPTKSTTPEFPERLHKFAGAHHYSELARITTGLFIGVLALMTFLLTAGLQHPQPLFSWFIYISLIALPLNLVVFTLAHSLQQQELTAPEAKTKSDADASRQWSGLRMVRLLQQLLFVVSIIAVTGLALVSAHIFFSPPAAQSQQQTQAAQ
jgi:hypothetical protein